MGHDHEHKITKKRSEYNNLQSYDDELAIVLKLLENTKIVEKEILDEFEEVLKELVKLCEEEFPFYFKNGIINKKELSILIASLMSGKGSIETRIKTTLDKIESRVRQLQNSRLMAWLILDYEYTAQKTAASINLDYTQYMIKMTPQQKKEKVLQPWCKDGKTFIDRVEANTKDMDEKLRLVIIQGIKRGWSIEKMTEVFRTITGTAAYKAARLLRTETMAVYSKVTKEMYLEKGIEYIEIIGDAACGGICLDYVGEAIPLREAELGDDLPPYHPNCACSFCAYEEFEETSGDE
jgi:SPP1 gp7 family putative phage head morphogenesis protein